MTPLSTFLFYNNLSQKELAEYLDCSTSYISRICSGDVPLSEKIKAQIVNNERGWDTRYLLTDDNNALPQSDESSKNLIYFLNKKIVALEAENRVLREQLEWFRSQLTTKQ